MMYTTEARAFAVALMKHLTILAQQTSQTIGKENDYYVTLEQIEDIMKYLLEEYGR